jgi:hypothetical protein
MQTVYIIKVIEAEKEYMKYFTERSLKECKRVAQEYLWSCPEKTKHIYVATRMKA